MTKPSLLEPGREVEPALKSGAVVPFAYREPTACSFKVRDGDSLAELAIFARMKASSLCKYNFGTTDSKNINWHLRNNVGCVSADWDKRNYKFSALDDPGIIFFPLRHYKSLLAAGITPTPTREDEDYRVPGVVPSYWQGLGPLCWAAAVGMMLGYKWGRSPLPDLIERHAGTKWRDRLEKRESIYSEEMKELAHDCGMQSVAGCPTNHEFWLRSIRRYGPLCIGQHVGSSWDHWIVATGYKVIFPDTRHIIYKDPGRSGIDFDHVENIAESSRRYSYGASLPIFYHF